MPTLFDMVAQAPSVRLWVPGVPQPGGSKKAFVVRSKHTGKLRAVVTDDAKHGKDWRATVKHYADRSWGRDPLAGPVVVVVRFVMPRLKSHYRADGVTLKGSAPAVHTVKPDATKLWRSTEDALTGILWRDDTQVVCQTVGKVYGEKPGALIQIWEDTMAGELTREALDRAADRRSITRRHVQTILEAIADHRPRDGETQDQYIDRLADMLDPPADDLPAGVSGKRRTFDTANRCEKAGD